MTTTRQDAWSKDEDILLAEIVLRHIREGGTQLQAFEEVGKLLSRTSAACGFRWNSYVRKQYKSGIELAKKQRKQLKKTIGTEEYTADEVIVKPSASPIPVQNQFDEMMLYLKDLYDKASKWEQENIDSSTVKEKTKELEEKLTILKKENEELQSELDSMEGAYKALVELMEKARQMVVFKDEDKLPKV
ncbi:RsfA family transcriptional regulator [Niallia sp.]|uniref:RsfA family transcriptional regulator n=1 Tax=Niallia sp. TaxID=2837523 RepID=UPI00289DFD97|nr:RsfA family transcriptional regulator [Niallia sp.]